MACFDVGGWSDGIQLRPETIHWLWDEFQAGREPYSRDLPFTAELVHEDSPLQGPPCHRPWAVSSGSVNASRNSYYILDS
jgi:hypothetical protein